MKSRLLFLVLLSSAVLLAAPVVLAEGAGKAVTAPFIDGDWWQIAGQPDLGKFTDPAQEPVDFSIWPAADGTWQLWSCIRHTKCGGNTRLLFGWEGAAITSSSWRPTGIKMQADTKLGETAGGLQAPHVVLFDGIYYMLYGDWEHICLATSRDGKKFERQVLPSGKTGMFTEGQRTNTRDPFAMLVESRSAEPRPTSDSRSNAQVPLGSRHLLWYVYYTAFPNRQGAVYCRTSPDLRTFSESTAVAFGGRAGVRGGSAECPQVVEHDGYYYLFRTQHYSEAGGGPRTSVYASTDPLNFGINQDRLYYVTELPIAAPEIVEVKGQQYIAALLPNVKGIRIAKLGWREKK